MQENSLKVAQLSGDPPGYSGGLGRTVRVLRDGLKARGHIVDCFSPGTILGELKISALGAVDFSHYDIVHAHGPTPFVSDLVRLNPTVNRLALTYHSDNEWLSHVVSKSYLTIHRVLHERTALTIFESETYRTRYGPTSGLTVVIPPPGSDWKVREDVFGHKSNEFLVLFVGQLRAYKGIRVLLEAARLLPTVRFEIAGLGRLEQEVIRASSRLQNVKFLGRLTAEELETAYLRSHVICLPSINNSEAYGFTLLEGATLGAFPIASALPGVTEHVGLLGGEVFPTGDAGALARSIARLATDRRDWHRRAAASMEKGIAYSRSHTNELFVRQHEQAYRLVV